MPRSRIQAWSLREGLVHRWFKRRSLRVDSASVEAANDQRSLRDLAPLATPETMDALIRHLLPGGHWPMRDWRPLHPRAWRRQFTLPALFALALRAFVQAFSQVGQGRQVLAHGCGHQLGRSRGGGRTQVGTKIGDGEVGFMPHATDDGHRAGDDGARQRGIVEGPQVFNGAATAHQQNHVDGR